VTGAATHEVAAALETGRTMRLASGGEAKSSREEFFYRHGGDELEHI
jgi:hypothetical protein